MSNISITEEGKHYDKSKYFSGSQILNHDYQDKLTNIFINSHCSLNWGERMNLANNIDQVRKIFSEHTDNNINSVWIGVFDIRKLDTDEFKKRGIQEGYWKNSIHVKFGGVQGKVLVYSWLDIDQFNQDKWNNLLSQLEGDYKINLIGTGPLIFKYKDFNYRVYPPLFGSSGDEKSFLNRTEVFSLSPTEVNQIIEDIKESHQSIKKKIASYYESLGKDFAENNKGYIYIKAGIDENNVKNFTDVSYTNRSDNIHNNPIEEVFVKDGVGGNFLHSYVYDNKEALMRYMFNLSQYNDDSINAVNTNGRTPLHLAAKYGRKSMVEMLLNKGVKVDVIDNRGKTPLHLAAQYNEKKEIVEMLLNKGVKVDVIDNRGRTPLHLAAANGHKEVVEVLLAADGINVNAVDEDRKTPLDLTTNEEIKTLLKKAAENPDDVSSVGGTPPNNAGESSDPPVEEENSDNIQPQPDNNKKEEETSAERGTDVKTEEEEKSTTSAEKGADVKTEGVDAPAEPNISTQNEEQPSSFFGSLFSILMKPFSLIGSFFSGFFSWLFGSDEEKTDESIQSSDTSVEQNNGDHNDQSDLI